jgi:hypothetical protein
MADSDQSLVNELRTLLEARKREDPRITAMVADVKLIRTEIRGMNQSVNLALGNSRESVMHVTEIFDRISQLESLVTAQAAIIEEQAAAIRENTDRMDRASEYLKTKGMK